MVADQPNKAIRFLCGCIGIVLALLNFMGFLHVSWYLLKLYLSSWVCLSRVGSGLYQFPLGEKNFSMENEVEYRRVVPSYLHLVGEVHGKEGDLRCQNWADPFVIGQIQDIHISSNSLHYGVRSHVPCM